MPFISLPCLPNAPRMYIPPLIATSWIGNFVQRKYASLSIIAQRPEDIRIPIDIVKFKVFLETITGLGTPNDGVRIYFGSYKKNGDPDCDNAVGSKEHLLTVIFVPTHTDEGNNQIDGTNFWGINETYDLIPLSYNTVTTWIGHFRKANGKWEKLTSLIHKDETKCISYSNASLLEFIEEIKCFQQHGNPSYVAISFGAYEEGRLIAYIEENVRKTYDIGNQLCLFFSIQDEDKHDLIVHTFSGITDYDTGTPCPPEINCIGATFSH